MKIFSYSLYLLQKSKAKKSFDLKNYFFLFSNKEYIIGRDEGSDIPLNNDDYVSKINSKIYFSETDENLFIKNYSKTNGTIVNGKKIEKIKLQKGDIIKVGSTEFLVRQLNVAMLKTSILLFILIVLAINIWKYNSLKSLQNKTQAQTNSIVFKQQVKDIISNVDRNNSSLMKKEFIAKPISELNKDSQLSSYLEMANIFYKNEHYEKAIIYYKKAKEYCEKKLIVDSIVLNIEPNLKTAIKKNNERIRYYYNKSLKCKKYKKFKDEEFNLKIVIELSVDKNNDYYNNSIIRLKELSSKNQKKRGE